MESTESSILGTEHKDFRLDQVRRRKNWIFSEKEISKLYLSFGWGSKVGSSIQEIILRKVTYWIAFSEKKKASKHLDYVIDKHETLKTHQPIKLLWTDKQYEMKQLSGISSDCIKFVYRCQLTSMTPGSDLTVAIFSRYDQDK